MTVQQKKLVLKNLNFFFTANDSPFVQINNAIKSTDNKTVKCLLITNSIDLLAQYYSGDLKNNKTSKRFKDLLIHCGQLSNEEAELMYQFRNALSHHFGTFSFNHLANKKYRFKIHSENKQLFEERNSMIYVSDIILEKRYFQIIDNVKNMIKNDIKRTGNFMKVFRFIHPEI